ncbi:SNF1-related protein kinase regulatory subunit gamma-1 [Magnolia sinica]|uniref:SNF1-related protein kinase regulatory subunit gamma-1 n=1 Tax=Magnolia sinica TaxID=86752 RepID=UPI00265AC17B|nr:SNF1-related protein kinase regulatory subunit gamma-1 [Magnolia sinica]
MERSSSGLSSPEAELGHRVEDIWESLQEPLLSPSEKLNSCFQNIPVSSFPPAPSSQVIEINSDSSLAEAVQILSSHKILSAPVRNVDAPEDASWIDRYIGIVEFAGIAVWILHQSEVAALGMMAGSAGMGLAVGGLVGTVGAAALGTPASAITGTALPAAAGAGASAAVGPGHSGPEAAASMGGNFFEALTSSDFYKNTKVLDISGSFRWAPFLALQKSDSFLTMLLLLSKYRMKSLPVVDLGEVKIDNIITQSAVVHMLAECVGLPWFENWGTKSLSELGLPIMKPSQLVKVNAEEPVLQAFKLMREKGVGGLPVVEDDGRKAIGNISIRDVQFLLTTPDIHKDYRSITAKTFLTAIRSYLEGHDDTSSPMLLGTITCQKHETIKDVILRLDSKKIHRVYVVDEEGNLEGVITLRDIISKLVHEPPGYFGDFFDGVVPLPPNSRV